MINNPTKKIGFLMLLTSLLAFMACKEQSTTSVDSSAGYIQDASNPDHLHAALKQLTDVIVEDIFSPPVASRIYAYACIAAYEPLVHGQPGYVSMAGQLKGLESMPQPEADLDYCYPLASTKAFLETGKALIFSEHIMDDYEKDLMEKYKAMGIPQAVYDRSMEYGKAVSKHILSWADSDMYKETRTYPKYSIPEDVTKWTPTPPDYMDGIEPHWMLIRPMILDSAKQFVPPPPTPFNMDKNSQFYKELMEVYLAVKDATKDQLAIAEFWDCNPFVSHHKGHAMFATKKITPGGHWMGIAYIASRKKKADLMQTAVAYALTSISLFDGFISCWDEKYRSNLVRPETVINRKLDEDWSPHLQTPPFPEYTSGHSVISSAAAITLTSIYGDNFDFVDSTEVEYGLPSRSFNSFIQASEEAAVSRLYGGIHYRPAIDLGVKQGRAIGQLVVDRVKVKK